MMFWTRLAAQWWLVIVGTGSLTLTLMVSGSDGQRLFWEAAQIALAALAGSAVVWLVGTPFELPIKYWKFSSPSWPRERIPTVQFREKHAVGAILFYTSIALLALVLGTVGMFYNPKDSYPLLILGLLGVPFFAALLVHNLTITTKADHHGLWIRSALGWNEVAWAEVKEIVRVTTTNRPKASWATKRVGNPLDTSSETLIFRNRSGQDVVRINPKSDPPDGVGRLLEYAQTIKEIARSAETSGEPFNIL